jgi:hypothetical protein
VAAGESAVLVVEAGKVIVVVLSRNTKKVDIFDDLKSKNNKSNYRDCEGWMVGGWPSAVTASTNWV